jgi:hypothetical protein
MADYSRAGARRRVKNTPKHERDSIRGGKPNKDGRATKEEMLARMKAAADARKRDTDEV